MPRVQVLLALLSIRLSNIILFGFYFSAHFQEAQSLFCFVFEENKSFSYCRKQVCNREGPILRKIFSLMSFFLACLLPVTTPTHSVPKIVWSFKMPTKNSLYLGCLGLLIIGGSGWVFSTLELLQKKLNKDTFAVVGKVFDEQLTFQMFTWVESLNC